MLVLLIFLGPRHPPTANDDVPLGLPRYALGLLVFVFMPLGFVPDPFEVGEEPSSGRRSDGTRRRKKAPFMC